MRIKRLITALAMLAVIGASCGKDNTPGLDDGNGLSSGKISMKVDGVLQETDAAYVFAVNEEDADHYLVSLAGMFTDKNTEVSNMFTIFMALTPQQFSNPKGTHDVLALNSDPEERSLVYALYQTAVGADNYRHYTIPVANTSVGKLTITDFEIGNQTGIPGVSGKGYTKLKGTFHMNLTELKSGEFGGEIAITEGKFDVKNKFGFF